MHSPTKQQLISYQHKSNPLEDKCLEEEEEEENDTNHHGQQNHIQRGPQYTTTKESCHNRIPGFKCCQLPCATIFWHRCRWLQIHSLASVRTLGRTIGSSRASSGRRYR